MDDHWPSLTLSRLCGVLALAAVVGAADAEPKQFMLGATVCDFLAHQTWGKKAPGWDPLAALHQHGISWVRVGVTTQRCPELRETTDWSALPWRHEYWSCLEYAERILRQATDNGLRLNVFLFLSDEAAHGGRQAAPKEWEGLSLEETCDRVKKHCFDTAAHFREQGLNVEVYEIGNEIERGVLGFPRFAPGTRIDWLRKRREDTPWLHENVWRTEAMLLKAAIRGIKRAEPTARVLLHIGAAPPPGDAYVTAFFEAMIAESVQFDYAGLSVYPRGTRWADWEQFASRWVERLADMGKPAIVSEFSYPNAPLPKGAPLSEVLGGFPFTPEGQAAFVRDFLTWCRRTPNVLGSFYFYADHIPGWGETPLPGLFLEGEPPRPAPALAAFR